MIAATRTDPAAMLATRDPRRDKTTKQGQIISARTVAAGLSV